MKKLVSLMLSCCCCFALEGQEQRESETTALENLVENSEEEPENDQLQMETTFAFDHPFSINKMSAEDLQSLNILSAIQIESFLLYKQLFGPFESKYELQAIPYWDIAMIKKLLPYLRFGEDQLWEKKLLPLILQGQHQLLARTSAYLEKSKGFKTDSSGIKKYTGSPYRSFLRYHYQLRQQLWYGFSTEKDAGEKWGDFVSFHLFIKRNGWLRCIAVGDYVLNFGQGLVIWQGLAFGKTGEAIAIFRQGRTLQPYRSAGEWNFQRGLATSFVRGNWELILFASHKKRSGNLVSDGNGDVSGFSSLPTSGYHRTETELADKGAIRETAYGGMLQYKRKAFRIGIEAIKLGFSLPYQPSDEPYNLYSWRGSGLWNAGIDYSYNIRNIFLFGEIAQGQTGNAFLQGAVLSLSPKLDLSLLWRYFDPGYQVLYAAAFSENSKPSNENGIYTGWKLLLSPRWSLQAYMDFFRFPWLRFRADAPGIGYDCSFQLNYVQRHRWNTSFRLRTAEKPENDAALVISQPVPKQKTSWRLHLNRELGKQVQLTLRYDGVWFRKASLNSTGWSLFLDGRYKWVTKNLSLSTRLFYFNTGGYDTRIYAYETDLLYSFAVPSLYDRGWRYYTQLQGKINGMKKPGRLKLQWWLKWSQTIYRQQQSIGSGNDEIEGGKRSEWKAQLMFTW